MAVKNPDVIVVRGTLQNVSIKYGNTEYVADRVFPMIDGLTRKSQVVKYNKGAWFRDEAEVRGRGTAARLVGFNITRQSLDPVNFAAASKVPDEDRDDAEETGASPIQPDIDAIELIAGKLDLKKEVRTNAAIQAADWSGVGVGGEDANGNWGHTTAASDTYLADLRKAKDAARAKSGVILNTLLIDYKTFSKLSVAPALLALTNPTSIKSTNATLTLEALTALSGVKEIIVGSALKATNEETALDPDSAFVAIDVWGNSDNKGMGFLFYKPERAGLKQVSAGYTYRLSQKNKAGRLSTTWREDKEHSDYYDTQENVDIAPVALDAGYLFKDTVED